MPFPNIENVKLGPDDRAALDRIKDKLEAGKVLQLIITIAPFALLFTGPPSEGFFSVLTTEWDAFAGAARGVPDIARTAARTEAELMRYDATTKNDAKRAKFWAAMVEALR